jgi:hypothetical protein
MFKNLFKGDRLTEATDACRPIVSNATIPRCKAIKDFYQCAREKLSGVLELTITAPFGNPGNATESSIED